MLLLTTRKNREVTMFVEIYGRLTCPYCIRAKALAEKMKSELADFDFKPVETVPQIFLDNIHVGGCTDFQALVKEKFGIEV